MTALLIEQPAGKHDRVMTISYAVERYLGELARQGKQPRTIYNYRRYLNELADMYEHIDIEDVTTDMGRRWLDRICTRIGSDAPLDVDTISQRIGIGRKFFEWLRIEGIIEKDPLERVKGPQRKNPIENDRIVWLTAEETRRMWAVALRDVARERDPADKYRKALCLGVLSYTGARRSAVARLRISDYDAAADPPTLRFREKGGKTIKKPAATRLADLIREADLAGVWDNPNDYLIPSRTGDRYAARRAISGRERGSKVIYALVKEIARDAGVTAHVHAIRAAFACFFLEANPDQLTALKDLLGHSQTATTEVYLRRMDRQRGMEAVVDLDWGETDGAGFEPAGRASDQLLSRQLPSATRAPVQATRSVPADTFEEHTDGLLESLHPSFDPLSLSKPNGCLERGKKRP